MNHGQTSQDYIRSGDILASKQDLTGPMARKDIFLAGSVRDLVKEYRSNQLLDTKNYIASLTHIPDHSQVLRLIFT